MPKLGSCLSILEGTSEMMRANVEELGSNTFPCTYGPHNAFSEPTLSARMKQACLLWLTPLTTTSPPDDMVVPSAFQPGPVLWLMSNARR